MLAQAVSPVSAAHAPDLSNLFWSVAFLGARFICEDDFVVHRAEAVRIHPGAGADAGWDKVSRQWQTLGTWHSLADLELLAGFGCLQWPSCSSGAKAELSCVCFY